MNFPGFTPRIFPLQKFNWVKFCEVFLLFISKQDEMWLVWNWISLKTKVNCGNDLGNRTCCNVLLMVIFCPSPLRVKLHCHFHTRWIQRERNWSDSLLQCLLSWFDIGGSVSWCENDEWIFLLFRLVSVMMFVTFQKVLIRVTVQNTNTVVYL